MEEQSKGLLSSGDANHHPPSLLPAGLPPPLGPSNPVNLLPKRQPVSAACEYCRKKKAKCTAERPKCRLCVQRGVDCKYLTNNTETHAQALKRKYNNLQDLKSPYEELFYLLRSKSEKESNEIVQRIRAGGDVGSILRQIKDGDLLLQLSLVPETRYRSEFPFQREMPSSLRIANQPYLQSLIYEATSVVSAATSHRSTHELYCPQYLKPYHASVLVDTRLAAVKPSKWTTVSTDDDFMRALLNLYLFHEYHWLSCFHKDYFLDDMLSGSERFCSSLLVNAVLALACHCHLGIRNRFEHWNPYSLGYRFLAEAKREWELEQGEKSSLTIIQADIIFNVIFNMHLMDKIGTTYAIHAVAMAHDLKLFAPSAQVIDERRQRAYDYTAWCLYWWTSLQCYHFLIQPLVKDPPSFPLPDPDQDPQWYGETWVQYPLSQTLFSTKDGSLFKAKMELGLILNALATRLFDIRDGDRAKVLSETSVDFPMKLTTWFSSLPPCLTPAEIVFPFQLKLHLTYHNIMMNLCKLSTVSTDMDMIDASSQSNLAALSSHSRVCFETILRLYYLRHGFEHSDIYITHHLQVLAFMALEQLRSTEPKSTDAPAEVSRLEDVRSALILAAKGLSDQGRNYYTPFALFHIVRSEMSTEDVDTLYKWINIRREDDGASKVRAKHVLAQYPVNLVNMTEHPEKQRLGDVIKKYASLALETHSTGTVAEDDS